MLRKKAGAKENASVTEPCETAGVQIACIDVPEANRTEREIFRIDAVGNCTRRHRTDGHSGRMPQRSSLVPHRCSQEPQPGLAPVHRTRKKPHRCGSKAFAVGT
jgi:hypothetical protein